MAGRAGSPAVMAATAAMAAVTAAALLVAGCGSPHGGSSLGGGAGPGAARPPSLSTSFSAGNGTSVAILEMGGSSAQHNNFWQLFARPAATANWKLVTPLGVADNGGLVVATSRARSLVTGFRPSQDLTFSPVASSADDGPPWSQGAPVEPGLADAPDALAAGPDGRLIALTTAGRAQLGTHLGAEWTNLASSRSLARTAAGRACGLTRLTAAGFAAGGAALLAGDCAKPGVAGIFALRGGGWQAAGPALPASLARSQVAVLGLSAAGTQTTALLQVGSGPAASTMVAWSATGASSAAGGPPTAGGPHWNLSALLRTGPAGVRSAAVWAAGAAGLVLAGGRGDTIAGPGHGWLQLAPLPAGTQTLAAGPPGQVDALAAAGSRLTDWRLAPGSSSWKVTQTIQVAIPYGSSG